MTLGALIDAGVDAEAIRAAIASLGLPITLKVEKVRKGGFAATYVQVEAPDEHKHRHLHHVEEILNRGSLTPKQRELALRIFRRVAEAEAAVHGIADREGPFSRGRGAGQHRRHRRGRRRARPARRRALHQPIGADGHAGRCNAPMA